MQKFVDVDQTKEFAATFFGDPILRMAVCACLDHAPKAVMPSIPPGHKDDNNLPEIAFKNGTAYCKEQIIEKLTELKSRAMGGGRRDLSEAIEIIQKMEVR